MDDAAPTTPFIVQYGEIPPSPEGAGTGARIRPFRGQRLLEMSVPDRGVALELVQLPPREHAARRSASRGLMIVVEGAAQLVTGAEHPVQAGDAVTIPGGLAYELTAGPAGFEAFVVSFSDGEGESTRRVLTLAQLQARNEERTQAALQKPFFRKLTDELPRDPADRRRLYDGLRVFSEAIQTLRFARQATCSDADHAAVFLGQLRNALAPKDFLAARDATPVAFDPVLDATASWFCNQMFVLDDLDKAVVNLVLETAGGHLHRLVERVFAGDVRAKYLATQALGGEQKLGLHFLEHQPPQVYRRLGAVLDRSWEMFEVMAGRILELVERRTEGLTHGA